MMTTIADCSSLRRFEIDSRMNRTVHLSWRVKGEPAASFCGH
jgi:hypothetical protein